MTDKTKKLPCPFCGSAKIKTVVDDGIHFDQCLKCEATGPTGFKRGDEDDANWNTRAAHAKDVRAVVEEPVAWMLEGSVGGSSLDFQISDLLDTQNRHGGVLVPLYRHPHRSFVLPERIIGQQHGDKIAEAEQRSWNACLDAVETLNK